MKETMQQHKENKNLQEIQNALRITQVKDPCDAMIAVCSAFLIKNTSREDISSALRRNNIDPTLTEFVTETLKNKPAIEKASYHLAANTNKEDLLYYIIHGDNALESSRSSDKESTAESLCDLAVAILNIKETDTVADIGCGMGSFLLKAHSKEPKAALQGVDISIQLACVAKLRLSLLRANANITIADALANPPARKYDKAFINLPLNLRARTLNGNGAYYDIAQGDKSIIGRPLSADWVFNKLGVDSLSETGKAVTIISNGAAVNERDIQARKYFIDNCLIQAIVALPEKLMDGTSISTTLLVLSEGSDSIMMVDATDIFIPMRRKNVLDSECINKILGRLATEGEHSRMVARDQIIDADYNLYPKRYLRRDLKLENPTKLETVVGSVERGRMYSSEEMDSLETDEDTGICYVRLTDIRDGRIQPQLKHLRTLGKDMDKSVLKNGDLLIPRFSTPPRVTVAEVPEDKILVAGHNIFVLRLDQRKVNPYFLAAFFESNDGKESLERVAVGTTNLCLPIKKLMEVEIPLPSLDKQNKIAKAYQEALDEVEALKSKLKRAQNAVHEAYSEAMTH